METRPENTIPEVVRVFPDANVRLQLFVMRRTFQVLFWMGAILIGIYLPMQFGAMAGLGTKSIGPLPVRFIGLFSGMMAWLPLHNVWKTGRKYVAEWKKEIAESRPPDNAHPLGQRLRDAWSAQGRCPSVRRIQRVADASPKTGRPTLAVMGSIELPKVGDRFFEPVVFTPGQMHKNSSAMLWIGIGFLLIAGLAFLQIIPLPARFVFSQSIGYLFFGAISVFYYIAFRPTYIRFAPGRIQFVRYAMLRRRRPVIEDYSMGPGVAAIVRSDIYPLKYFRALGEKRKARGKALAQLPSNTMTILLYKDGRWRKISPLRMGRSKDEIIDAFWNSVLSTARQPELDEAFSV